MSSTDKSASPGEHGRLAGGAGLELQHVQWGWWTFAGAGGSQGEGGWCGQDPAFSCAPQIEARAQGIVATIRIYESVLVNVPSVIYCIFAGTFFPTSLFGPSHTFRSLERHKWPQASHYSAHDRTDPGCRRFDLCSFLSKPASRVSSVVVSCGEQSHWLCQGLVYKHRCHLLNC